MNDPSGLEGPCKRILLATDLSARSDRALDRALSLSREWNAELIVLHALEGEPADAVGLPDGVQSRRRPAEAKHFVRSQLLADLGPVADRTEIVIERGDPVAVITQVAVARNCDLIVAGVARDELLGAFNLGSTVKGLARNVRIPLLVVKNRVRHEYRHVVVGTDFSGSSRRAIEVAAQLFFGHQLTMFHAYSVPRAAMMTDSVDYRLEYRNVVERECEDFLRGIKTPAQDWPPLKVLLEYGDPYPVLSDYISRKSADLLVLGSHGRSAIFEILLGSTVQRFLDDLPTDVLIIRGSPNVFEDK